MSHTYTCFEVYLTLASATSFLPCFLSKNILPGLFYLAWLAAHAHAALFCHVSVCPRGMGRRGTPAVVGVSSVPCRCLRLFGHDPHAQARPTPPCGPKCMQPNCTYVVRGHSSASSLGSHVRGYDLKAGVTISTELLLIKPFRKPACLAYSPRRLRLQQQQQQQRAQVRPAAAEKKRFNTTLSKPSGGSSLTGKRWNLSCFTMGKPIGKGRFGESKG